MKLSIKENIERKREREAPNPTANFGEVVSGHIIALGGEGGRSVSLVDQVCICGAVNPEGKCWGRNHIVRSHPCDSGAGTLLGCPDRRGVGGNTRQPQ